MAVFTIGGQPVTVPIMSLKALRVCARNSQRLFEIAHLAQIGAANPAEVDEMIDLTLQVISAALEGTDAAGTPEELNVRIRGMAEMRALEPCLRELMIESGFMERVPGEGPPAGDQTQTTGEPLTN